MSCNSRSGVYYGGRDVRGAQVWEAGVLSPNHRDTLDSSHAPIRQCASTPSDAWVLWPIARYASPSTQSDTPKNRPNHPMHSRKRRIIRRRCWCQNFSSPSQLAGTTRLHESGIRQSCKRASVNATSGRLSLFPLMALLRKVREFARESVYSAWRAAIRQRRVAPWYVKSWQSANTRPCIE